jgi:tetratricopeptide (TPR) repeat protein
MREGLQASRKAGATQLVAWITGSLGDFETLLGNLTEAEVLGRESIELARAIGDDPLLGMRLTAVGSVVAARGRIDEASEAYEAAGRILADNPEPQAEFVHLALGAEIALGRGDRAGELTVLRALVDLGAGASASFEFAPELFPEVVRRAVDADDRELSERLREVAAHAVFPPARACAANIEGLLATEPQEQLRLLSEAVERFEELGMRVHLARGLIDLGRAQARLGRDGRSSFERARDLLIACDAQLYLPDVEEALAALDAPA